MEFKRIGRESREIIEKYTKHWSIENADYCFTTLYLWGRHGKITYAEHENALFLLYQFPEEQPFFTCPLPLCKDADYRKLIDAAFDYLKGIGAKPSIRSISPPFYDMITSCYPELKLSRTRNADDYVYDADALRTLAGKKLHSKRNHINRFMQDNPNWEYVKLNSSMLKECMSLYEEWQEHKDEEQIEELEEFDEKLTVELAVKHMDEFGLMGGGIKIDGNLQAFTVGEKVTDDMAIVHIEKANADINGLYPLINREFVLHECGFANFINREDDMGLEGLRKAKLSYYPSRMIEKYMATED